MWKNFQVLLLLLLVPITASLASQPSVGCSNPLYEIDSDGNILSGSKTKVIEYALSGEPMRVGWDRDFDQDGNSDLAHWSEARFVSVFNGEVVTQVESIHRQSPSRKSGAIHLPTTFDRWHGIIDTRGMLQGRLEQSENVGERKVRSVWCAIKKPSVGWQVIYKHDTKGTPLHGRKAALINAVRAGQPLQIGWGLSVTKDNKPKSVEHLVSPVFVTISDGVDVIAQMPEHIAQQSYWNTEQAIFDDGSVMWRGLATTQGVFDAIWVDRASGEMVRRAPQRAAFSWYTYGPIDQAQPAAKLLSMPKGVISDELRKEQRIQN